MLKRETANHPLPSHVHWFFWGLPVGHVWKASSGEHASLGGSIIWSNHLNWFTGHPGKETHFGCLCPWTYSFSHDPRLLAIDASWEVDWPVNRGSTCGSAPSSRQQIGFPSHCWSCSHPSDDLPLYLTHTPIFILKLLHLVSDFRPVPEWTLHFFFQLRTMASDSEVLILIWVASHSFANHSSQPKDHIICKQQR